MDVQWFFVKSWHIYAGFTSRGYQPRALCGRWGAAPPALEDKRGEGKSCETCLRINSSRSDK